MWSVCLRRIPAAVPVLSCVLVLGGWISESRAAETATPVAPVPAPKVSAADASRNVAPETKVRPAVANPTADADKAVDKSADKSADTEMTAEEGKPAEKGAKVFRGRAGFFKRLPPRTERTAEERKEFVERLRVEYSRPSAEWSPPQVDAEVRWVELGRLPKVTFPEDNPFTKQKAELGRLLFFDPRLSGSGQIACASCHDPDLAWADGRTTSFGHQRTSLARNAPSIVNTAFLKRLFWDGRADSLEDQARQVLLNPLEMHSTEAHLVSQLQAIPEYKVQFDTVFGEQSISMTTVTQALATFERTIVGGRSRFDRFLAGDKAALSDEELIGLDLFRKEGRCMNCHYGPTFTDEAFHDIGLSYFGRSLEDLGRYQQTKANADVGRFRTPSLRNVANTAPYMHNGVFPLTGVLNMYNAGMPTLTPKPDQKADPRFPTKSTHLRPLGLNQRDLQDLQAFLEALSEPRFRMRAPKLPGMKDEG